MIAMTLEGKVVIVTGAVRGIGRAIALKMAEAGCMGLAINDVKMDDAGKSVAAEAKAFGAEVLLLEGDMSDEDNVRKVIGATIDKWGRLDVMVNNAGIAIPDNLFDATTDDWDRVIRVSMQIDVFGNEARRRVHEGPWRRIHHQYGFHRRHNGGKYKS